MSRTGWTCRIALAQAAVLLGACSSSATSSSETVTAAPTTPPAAGTPAATSSTQAASSVAPSIDARPVDQSGPQNTGCIDLAGTASGAATDWYRDDASGVILLDSGVLRSATTATAALTTVLEADLAGYTEQSTWEFEAPSDSTCVVGRGAAVSAADGSAVRASIWRLNGPVSLASFPQHAPFALVAPDLLVSRAPASGDISLLKVLGDGTTIKIVALGPDALGFAGWPTTIAPPLDAPAPQPPLQTVDQLARLADDIAGVVNTERAPSG
ncbi:MAG: hypothetical protein JWN39_3763 [Ilumatobacteraceae bacterium]|nr:hypothetical protein [Ilumatobacteraceae bacterium]